jgi:multidrug efflux system outer membrane protein
LAGTEAVSLANALYAVGRTNFIDVLAAQRDLLDNEEALARSEQLVGTNLVALYKSLGGGWSIASACE